jgi:hypothetical protein
MGDIDEIAIPAATELRHRISKAMRKGRPWQVIENIIYVALGDVLREALSSQEEELAFMREAVEAAVKDRDYYEQKEREAESRYREEYAIVDRVWKSVRGGRGYKGEELSGIVADYVKRAESAEADLREYSILLARKEGESVHEHVAGIKRIVEEAEAELQRLREGMGRAFIILEGLRLAVDWELVPPIKREIADVAEMAKRLLASPVEENR